MRIDRRWLGFALLIGGLAMAAVGVIQLVGEDAPAPTTLSAPVTTAAATTSTSPSTTSSAPTTTAPATTTTRPPETVEEFVTAYRAALDADDIDYVFARLHPMVLEAYGAELCRSWVEAEILQLEDYRLAGEVAGPRTSRVQVPGGEVDVPLSFTATIGFVFQGSAFEVEAGFALVDGEMHWLGVCR